MDPLVAAPAEAVAPPPAPPAAGSTSGLRRVLGRNGAGLLVVLALIQLMDYVDSAALSTLAPEIQRSLGLSDGAFNAVISVQAAVFVVGAVPLGLLADRVRRRTLLASGAAAVAALATVATGLASSGLALVGARVVNETGQSAILPVHNALLADGYPLTARARVLGLHAAAAPAGTLVGPALAGGLAAVIGGAAGWRWVFVLLAVPSLVLAVLATRLRDPVRGAGELAAVGIDVPTEQGPDAPLPVSFGVAAQRLLAVPTFRLLAASVGVLGFVLVAVPTNFSLVLDRSYGLGPVARGTVISLVEVGALAGVLAGGALGDRLGARRTMRLLAASTLAFGVLFPVALASPTVALLVIGVGVAKAVQGVGTVPAYSLVASLAPYRLRSTAFTVLGLSIFVLGGFLGAVLTGLLSDSYGPRVALVLVVMPACIGSALLALRAATTVEADLAATSAELVREQAERLEAAAGGPAPALAVRGLTVRYGTLLVLDGLDLDVGEGEVIALLGTNGAGKSTLLRALSGLTPAAAGSVRLHGRSVTFVEPAARVRLGLVQVPGGRAVFGDLSVAENLLVACHTFAWDTETVRQRLDEVLRRFPVLAERLDQPAGLLSGGEQQMLALAKALMLRPRVLLIDELSLGLAPAVVADLVAAVRSLRDEGVTVVVVEQSVNVALALADRAVFLERGRLAFDGPTSDLLDRPDLLRAVFLGGAARDAGRSRDDSPPGAGAPPPARRPAPRRSAGRRPLRPGAGATGRPDAAGSPDSPTGGDA